MIIYTLIFLLGGTIINFDDVINEFHVLKARNKKFNFNIIYVKLNQKILFSFFIKIILFHKLY